MRALARGLVIITLMLCGCGEPATADTPSATGESDAEATSAVDDTSTTGAETGSETGSESESETESETGAMCTGELCASTLTLTFSHTLPLLDGPHRFSITTPLHELVCGVEASLEGQKSCFGFAFADLSWTADTVTVLLTNPFFESVDNPDAAPFESAMVEVERGEALIWADTVAIDAGEPMQPDPCGPVCWQAVGAATIE